MELATTSSSIMVPVPRVPIAVRLASLGDVPFMDALQRLANEAV